MKILYDLFFAQPLNNSKFHGGGEYMKTVYKHLIEYGKNCQVEVFFNPDKYLDDWIKELNKLHKIKTHFIHDLNELPNLFNRQFDVFYTGMPYQYNNTILPKNVKKIATVHGLRQAEKPADKNMYLYFNGFDCMKAFFKGLFPNYFARKAINQYQLCVSKFDLIVTDSNHSSNTVNVLLNLGNVEIRTFYAPAKVYGTNQVKESDRNDVNKIGKFILMLGGNRWEKNTYRVIQACDDLFKKKLLKDYKVVICGKVPKKVKKRMINLERYVFYDFVEADFLELLYEKCDFFVYPTLNEGFGMPPLEAMRYGKTCVVSAVCSLPELCGEAVYYVNPYDILEIENRLFQASNNKIDSLKILSQFNKINERQALDLNGLIQYISCNIEQTTRR